MTVELLMRDVLIEHGISLEKFVEEVRALSRPEIMLQKLEEGSTGAVRLSTLDLACRVTGLEPADFFEYKPAPPGEDALSVKARLCK